jgi:MFS transporter, NNP family, nitrate/nitrite transporter
MKFKGTPQQGLFGATLGFFIGFAVVSLFGPTAKKLQDLMQLTPMMVGFLVAMPSLSGSLLRIPFAAWVDTTGGRKPFLVLLVTSVIGMVGLTAVIFLLYPDRMTRALYPLLLLLGLLSGCGIATFSVGIGQVSYWFPQSRQGGALGAFAGIGNLAPGIFSLLLPLALGAWGLSGSYLAWLVFLIAGTILYFYTGRNAWFFQAREQGTDMKRAQSIAQEQGQEIFPAKSTKDSLLLSARVWKTWLLVGIYFTTFGGFIAMTSWLPTFWTSFFSLSAVTAGLLTAVYSLTASVIRISGGSLADRLGGEATSFLALSVMLAGALLMTVSQVLALSILAAVMMALGMGVANAAVFKLVPKEVPQAVGGAAGWVGGLGAFGGFAIPPILSAFVRSYGNAGYTTGFVTFIVLAIISLGLALILRRSHARVLTPQQAAD